MHTRNKNSRREVEIARAGATGRYVIEEGGRGGDDRRARDVLGRRYRPSRECHVRPSRGGRGIRPRLRGIPRVVDLPASYCRD